MKLLFDQNLSYRLVRALADLFPDSLHVRSVSLESADDEVVWAYAAERGLLIVSKDSDFRQRSLAFGSPPKVVWIRLGNCSTRAVEAALRRHCAYLQAFAADEDAAFLIVEESAGSWRAPSGGPAASRIHRMATTSAPLPAAATASTTAGPRIVRAPRGTEISCRGWLQ